MHRLYCSTLVAALLLGASLIADAGSSTRPQPLSVQSMVPFTTGAADGDGYLLIATDAAGEVTGIDVVSVR